jgi:hypothetical protein
MGYGPSWDYYNEWDDDEPYEESWEDQFYLADDDTVQPYGACDLDDAYERSPPR